VLTRRELERYEGGHHNDSVAHEILQFEVDAVDTEDNIRVPCGRQQDRRHDSANQIDIDPAADADHRHLRLVEGNDVRMLLAVAEGVDNEEYRQDEARKETYRG